MVNVRRSGWRNFVAPTDEQGATAIEYALLASLIAAVVAFTVRAVGQLVLALFQSVPIPFG
jgi:pilus assembly protein Flp/PilA